MNDAKDVSTLLETNIKISKELCPQNDEERLEMQKKPYQSNSLVD